MRPYAWLALLLVAAACRQATPPLGAATLPNDPVVQGGRLFQANCSACHGPEGRGAIGPAPALDGSAHAWHHPDQQLYDFICRGKPGFGGQDMPAFGDKMAPEEIRAVIAYMKSLWPPEQRGLQAQATEGLQGAYPPCP